MGAVATVLTTAVLLGLSMAERYIAVWRNTARFQVEIDEAAELTKALVALLHELGLDRKYWRINKSRDGLVGLLKVVGPEPKLEELQNRLMIEPGVKSLQRL